MPNSRKTVSLFEDNQVIEDIRLVVRSAGIPVSIDYVSRKIGMNWASTRAVMFQLSMDGRLKATKTTKSWIFEIPEDESNLEVGSKA